MQGRGLTLAAIARELSGTGTALPEASAWWQYRISPDVIVSVRADAAPWRLKQVREALEWMAARLAEKKETQ